VCRSQFVADNPQAVQKLVQTWFDTLKQMRSEPQASLVILAERAGVSAAEYREYDAGTTILSLDQNKQVFKPSGNMQSLPYAANQIAAFLQQQGLAKTPPNLGTLFQPQFVDEVK
jgi:NitT/TauT family transport system substrate-binding protein